MRSSTIEEVASVVTVAANHLDVSEFEIFRVSYASWYSAEAPDALLERHFGEYLKGGNVPFWVRHFSRQQLSEERANESFRGNLLAELELAFSLCAPVKRGAACAQRSILVA